MTLPAFDTWLIRGVDGPSYKVGPHCSMPRCHRYAEHAHHIVRRSEIGGAHDWIQVDGVEGVLANKTGLCVDHHNHITGELGGHRAAIRYDEGLFVWCWVKREQGDDEYTYSPDAPLFPQPPTPESLVEQTSGKEAESDHCPFCGQLRRRRSTLTPPGERRRRKTWTVSVPAQAEEDGAEVLDTLVDDLAPLLGYQTHDRKERANVRYFVLVPVLYYAHQNRKNFVASIKGAAA